MRSTRPWPTIENPDAIIVGSGAGGGTAAAVLTARGKRVVVFEKGPMRDADDFLPLDELHFHAQKALIPHVNDDPNIYVGSDSAARPVERWWNANMVGGSTMIWDANMPRYTTEDFRLGSFLPDGVAGTDGASVVDWPWEYESWLPYFAQAESMWCVSGRAGQTPTQDTPADYRYPMEPLVPHVSTEFLQSAFGRAGMSPYLGPRAINSREYDDRPPCSFCGLNQFFGCTVDSRANAWNTVLQRARSTGLCDLRPGHCVTRIEHANGVVRGVWYITEPHGREYFLGASVVIVSTQPIESARLLLYSELPNRNDLIGRYLVYHPHANLEFTFKDREPWVPKAGDAGRYQPRTAIGSLQLRDLYVVDDPGAPDVRKAGKFSIYDEYTTVPPIRLMKTASFSRTESNLWGARLQERIRELRREAGVYFSFTGEGLPRYDNRVTLDPDRKDPWGIPVARTHYRHHAYDVRACQYALDRVATVMTDAGGELRKYEPQREDNPGYGHVHGTLRAGNDPATSVLDTECQSHEVAGLYVVDSSFMPTGGASNPSITLIANAIRVTSRLAL